MTSRSIIIPKPTPHLVTTNTISSTEYYRYDDVLNDVDDDQHYDGGHSTPQLNYDDSMDTTMDHVSVSSVIAAPPPTTVNCIHTTTTSSCSSINSRFQVLKEQYLAPASPERASGKWMLMNAFCLVWSLSLGVYILLLYFYYDEFEQQQDDNDVDDDTDDGSTTVDNPASRESTTDYLLWSLFTCFVWIIEVALRIAFPAMDTVIKVVKSRSTDNLEAATAAAAALESIRSIITVETIVEHRNKKQITIIILELILAAYFVLQTIQDCYKHWKTHHHPRYQNDDENVNVYADYYDYFDTEEDEDALRAGGGIMVYTIVEQEVDVWVAVFAYAYMTYETYQKYYKIASTEQNIQRSLTNLTYGTIMGDDPPHDKDDRKQQQQQRQPIGGNDNDNDNEHEDTVEDGRNKKEDEDKGNTALLREVNVRVAKAENCTDDDDGNDDDDDNNYTPPTVHLQTIV